MRRANVNILSTLGISNTRMPGLYSSLDPREAEWARPSNEPTRTRRVEPVTTGPECRWCQFVARLMSDPPGTRLSASRSAGRSRTRRASSVLACDTSRACPAASDRLRIAR